MRGELVAMADRVLIRSAVPDDAEAIGAMNAAAWKAGFAGVVSEEYLARYDGAPKRRREDLLTMSAEAIQLVAEDRAATDGAAEDGGYVVGWLTGHPSEDEDCDPGSVFEVRSCYVAPTQWRAGVGRRLMQHLLDGLDRSRWRAALIASIFLAHSRALPPFRPATAAEGVLLWVRRASSALATNVHRFGDTPGVVGDVRH
jgi:hypothetical protein